MNSIEPSITECITSFQLEGDSTLLTIKAECCYPQSFPGFAGHFPDQPILPAIVQLATIRVLAERGCSARLQPLSYTKTKFRGMARPDQPLHIKMTLRGQDQGQFKGKFSIISAAEEPIASGNFLFAK